MKHLNRDVGDNDPVRFWHYISAACQTFQISQAALALLFTRTQPLVKPAFLETLITTLFTWRGRTMSESLSATRSRSREPDLHRSRTQDQTGRRPMGIEFAGRIPLLICYFR